MTAPSGRPAAYKLTATAKDPSGNDVAIATEIQGVVDSVDLTATPALLSIGGQNYTTDQIKRVMRRPPPARASATASGLPLRPTQDLVPPQPRCPPDAGAKLFPACSTRFVLNPWA